MLKIFLCRFSIHRKLIIGGNVDIFSKSYGSLIRPHCLCENVSCVLYVNNSTLQDVIDLRRAKWVKRQEEDGPKTIDQIHKEAQKDLRVKLAKMTPDPPPRRSEDRSNRRRCALYWK